MGLAPARLYPIAMKKILFAALCTLLCGFAIAQQVPDSAFSYPIPNPHFDIGKGPVVWLDEGHNNFHTLSGRYYAFGKLLEADGYQVRAFRDTFSRATLAQCRILVISNALHPVNANGNWQLPTPSAFTNDEIAIIQEWVGRGGSLFLIADHMPFGGAAADLAAALGFGFSNGFAMDNRRRNAEVFYRSNNTLQSCPITDGATPAERVDTIVTFTGQAFTIPPQAQSVLALNDSYTVLLPNVAWQFNDDTPWQAASGLHQLAYRTIKKGKVFVSGEAAMFSSQLAGPQRIPTGMGSPEARQNAQLLLNILYWLAGN